MPRSLGQYFTYTQPFSAIQTAAFFSHDKLASPKKQDLRTKTLVKVLHNGEWCDEICQCLAVIVKVPKWSKMDTAKVNRAICVETARVNFGKTHNLPATALKSKTFALKCLSTVWEGATLDESQGSRTTASSTGCAKLKPKLLWRTTRFRKRLKLMSYKHSWTQKKQSLALDSRE